MRNKIRHLKILSITLPSRIDAKLRQLIFWEFPTHNSVISATTFIKNGPNFAPERLFQAPCLLKSRNQVVQLPITSLFQPRHHSKLKNYFDFHIKVKKKPVKCMTMHTEKQIFRVWNSYKLLWKHLLPEVYTTEYRCAFNSF